MLSNWKFDWQHVLIALAFLVGVTWSGGAAIAALPAGQSAAAIFAALLPVLILGASHVFAFFKNPPSSPDQALQQGEQALGGASAAAKAASRGMARLGVLAVFAAIGVVVFGAQVLTGAPVIHPMSVQGQGCAWWTKNQQPVVQDLSKDAQCVLGAILDGARSPAAVVSQCVGITESQATSIATSLFNYYVLGQTDAGFAGAAPAPFRGIPSALDGSDLGKLRAFVGD